jgi:hypothetical protein
VNDPLHKAYLNAFAAIEENCEPCPQRAEALIRLREAFMWAGEAVPEEMPDRRPVGPPLRFPRRVESKREEGDKSGPTSGGSPPGA